MLVGSLGMTDPKNRWSGFQAVTLESESSLVVSPDSPHKYRSAS